MKSKDFSLLASLAARLGDEDARERFSQLMLKVYQDLRDDLSAPSLLLYEELRERGERSVPPVELPSLYSGGFLDERFSINPADFGVAFGLAMKKLAAGEIGRARQILERIANSGYRERHLAIRQLAALRSCESPAANE